MSGPEVEIAIPVHGRWSLVKHCLASLLACTRVPFRVHLLDDGSPEATRAPLADWARQHGARWTRHPVAQGFVKTANQALRGLRGDVLVLLNSDTELTPGWLQRCLAWLVPDSGPLMPLSNNASHYSLPLPGGEDIFGLAARLAARKPLRAPPLVTAAGFCLVFSRAVIERVGVFDEAYGRGYGEESDYCLRCHAQGLAPRAAPDVFVYHHGAASFGSFKRGSEAAANRERFFRRWGSDYRRLLAQEDTAWLRQLQTELGSAPAPTEPLLRQASGIWKRAGLSGLLRELGRAAPSSWRKLGRARPASARSLRAEVLFVCDDFTPNRRLHALLSVHNSLVRQGVRARLASLAPWERQAPASLSGPLRVDAQTVIDASTVVANGLQAQRWAAARSADVARGFVWQARQGVDGLQPLPAGSVRAICSRLVEKQPARP